MSTHLSADTTDPPAQGAAAQVEPEQVKLDPPTYHGPRTEDLNPHADIPPAFFIISPSIFKKLTSMPPEAFKAIAYTCLFFWAGLISQGILWYNKIDDPLIAPLLSQAKERARMKTGYTLGPDVDPKLVRYFICEEEIRMLIVCQHKFDQFAWDGFAYLKEYVRLIVRDTFSLGQWDLLSSAPNNAMRIGISRLLSSYSFTREGLQGPVGTHPVLEKLCFFVFCHPEFGIARAVDFYGVVITPRLVASLATLIYSALKEWEKGCYSRSLSFFGPYYDYIVEDMQLHMVEKQTETWNKWHGNIMQTQSSENARNSSTSVHEPPISSSASLQEGSLHQAPPAPLGPVLSTQPVHGALGASYRHTSRLAPHQNLDSYPDPSDQNLRRNRKRPHPVEDDFREVPAQQASNDRRGQDRSAAYPSGLLVPPSRSASTWEDPSSGRARSFTPSAQIARSGVHQAGHSDSGVELRHPYAAHMGPPAQTAVHQPPHHLQASMAAPPGADSYRKIATPALPSTIPVQPPPHHYIAQASIQGLPELEDRPVFMQGTYPATLRSRPPPQVGVGRSTDPHDIQQPYAAADTTTLLFGSEWEPDSISVPITGYYNEQEQEHARPEDSREGDGSWGIPGPSRGPGSNMYGQPVYKTMPRND